MPTETVSGQALYQWREWAIHLAKPHNIEVSEVDWFLQGLTHLSGLSLRLGDYRQQSQLLIKAPLNTLTEKWHQRINQRVPVQYLTGETPWRNFSLAVSPDVLIPRPETELIVDIAKTLVEKNPLRELLAQGHWADLGTGSGAIALGLSHSFPNANIHAVDISSKALAIAQLNANQNNLTHRITFHRGSWLSPLAHFRNRLAAIVSNPPYIPTQILPSLQPEVTQHEPHLALDGGADGLQSIKQLITTSSIHLQPGGLWLIELMTGQADTVVDLLKAQRQYTNISTHLDLAGIQRFVSARKAL